MLAACGVEYGWRADQESPNTMLRRAQGGGLSFEQLHIFSSGSLSLSSCSISALGPVPLCLGDGAAAADEEPERLEAEIRNVRGLGGTEGLVWKWWLGIVAGVPAGLCVTRVGVAKWSAFDIRTAACHIVADIGEVVQVSEASSLLRAPTDLAIRTPSRW